MQAIEKSISSEFWITLVLIFLFLIIFLLKAVDGKMLNQHIRIIFKVPFKPLDSDENFGVFNLYKTLIFLFTSIVFSLLFTYLKDNKPVSFGQFSLNFLVVLSYFLIKVILEYLLSVLFFLKKIIKLFLISKWNYLFSLCFYLYIAIILREFSGLTIFYFIILTLFFLLLRVLFIVATNKNLIFSNLFYFISYICAFEIAPLFILFKLII